MADTLTKTINIKAVPEKVWKYVNDFSNWEEWAIHNVHKATPGQDGFWLMDGPGGVSRVRMHSDMKAGILDHEFIADEGNWFVPCRVVAGSEGSHFMITFTKPSPMSEAAFEKGMKLLDEELMQLKTIMESL